MDADMVLAAMDQEGCNQCPNDCIAVGYPYCGCSDTSLITNGQGFGVLQESWNTSFGTLEHVSYVHDELPTQAEFALWFPAGLTPCTVMKDPVTAIAEFYWTALHIGGSNCYRIWQWIDPAGNAVDCCATTSYYDANPTSTNKEDCSFSTPAYTCTV